MTAVSRPSSACARRPAQRCRRAAVALLALALVLGGCGGQSRRDRVEKYLTEANAVQDRAAPELAAANKAYVGFSQHKLAAGEAPSKLAAAERSIRATRAELAGISPPADARILHRRILRAYDLDAGLAAEPT